MERIDVIGEVPEQPLKRESMSQACAKLLRSGITQGAIKG